MSSYLARMQMVRNHADYSEDSVGISEALRQLNKAKEMIELIQKVIEK